MKKATVLIAIAVMGMTSIFSQKKENGKIYIDHPAIAVVGDFVKTSVSGTESEIGDFLTEDFKAYNGTGNKPGDKGMDKAAFLKNAKLYQDKLEGYAIETFPGAYPDAFEYKKDNDDDNVVIQDWYLIKGLHKETGVKIDAAAFRIYYLTKDNKIRRIINYSNSDVLNEIVQSLTDRTNGIIYDHHENINTVRKAMYAFEKGDLDKCLSYYSDEAKFYDINDPFDTPAKTKSEIKILWRSFLDNFEIEAIEMFGYPDYLEYERDQGRNVLSWWKYHLIRKSDKEKIVLFMHFSNDFDADGKMSSEVEYYNAALLTK